MKKKILIYMAVLACIQVQAQDRWSLRQCIDYAIEHNIDIRRTANAAEQSNVEVNTAKWARLPNLNASAGQNWNWGRTQTAIKDESTGDYSTVYVNTGSHGTNMSVSTNIPLFTGLEIPNQYALAKLNLKAALADLEKAKEDISINIASAYLQVLFNEELHRVSLGQVELSKEQCNRIERLAEVGKASPAEVAEAKARVAQDEMNAVQTGNNYQLALLDLSQLIELETPKGFLLENPAVTIELIPLASPDEIYQLALGCKASIQAAQYRLEGSKHAKEEGVEFLTLHNPIEYIADEKGRVKQVVLQKMELGEPDASGRRSPVPIPGATETIDIDLAIVSVGVSPNPIVPSSIKGLELGRKGTIAVNDNMQSSIPTIFAGGDIVRGGATVILAMGDGRKAAAAMNEQLKK